MCYIVNSALEWITIKVEKLLTGCLRKDSCFNWLQSPEHSTSPANYMPYFLMATLSLFFCAQAVLCSARLSQLKLHRSFFFCWQRERIKRNARTIFITLLRKGHCKNIDYIFYLFYSPEYFYSSRNAAPYQLFFLSRIFLCTCGYMMMEKFSLNYPFTEAVLTP